MVGPPAGLDTTKHISKHHQRIHNRMHLHWSRRHAEKIGEEPHQQIICVATQHQHLNVPNVPPEPIRQASTVYKIFLVENKDQAMKFDLQRNSKNAHTILSKVLKLRCETFFSPSIDQKYVTGFTEFNYCSSSDNDDYKFCSNPSYCSNNGQSAHVWYDRAQISCPLTMMATNAFVWHRFSVFFLYQTNKLAVIYQNVIILVETMQLFDFNKMHLIHQLLIVEHGSALHKSLL